MFHPSRECSTESFPDLLLQLEPVPFRHALLDPPDQDGGGVDSFDVGGLVGGEQRDALPGQFLFQFERVEHVPAGPLDVLADHGGESGDRGVGLGEQVGQAAVAGEARAGELPVAVALAAVFEVDAAGLDVPVARRRCTSRAGARPWRSGSGGAGRPGVLERRWRSGPGSRPGPARPPAGGAAVMCLCWRAHCSSSFITAACCAFSAAAFLPVSMRILYRTLSPPGLSPSFKL